MEGGRGGGAVFFFLATVMEDYVVKRYNTFRDLNCLCHVVIFVCLFTYIFSYLLPVATVI